ncbi:MAG: serine/threonine dehydratase [Acidimicrobiia bacterium]
MTEGVSRADIESAAARIEPHCRITPILDLGHELSDDLELVLKLEHLQVTGSFKPRGAVSLLTSADVPAAGVVAASGGNYGIAIAYAARRLGHPATVFVPETSPEEKISLISRYGADVRVIPGYYDEALAEARAFVADTGALEAHAYDQHGVVAGQGTIAREIQNQAAVDTVVVAVGGGGLIGGVASWFRGDVDVVAVEPVRCQSLHASLEAGEQVEVEVGGVAASSLGARSVGDLPWAARRWITTSVVVEDSDIVDAQRWLWATARIAVEPAAATTVAALRTGVYRPPAGARVAAILSGGNVDPASVA